MTPYTSVTRQKLRALTIVVLPLLGTLLAMFLLWNKYFFAKDIAVLGGMYVVTTMGVTIGYHRMLTHQGFSSPPWLRAFFLILGSMAWEGTPVMWVSTHIKHHAHSDEEGDPHSPLHGFWHAHMGWLFDPKNFPEASVYAPHLLKDPVVMFVDRMGFLWMTLALAIPFAIGGWTGLLWGGVVRIFLTTHATWSVNSICHTFGRRDFETTDESRNEWIIGLIGFGEGWHNNHHAFPRSAFHGLRWWQLDMSGILIRILERTGLVWDVQRVSRETMDAQRLRALSMQESLQQMRSQLFAKIGNAQEEMMQWIERYGQPSVTDAELLQMTESCEEAVRRLNEIQQGISKATHLKKQRLQLYMNEVQELAERARTQMTMTAATVKVSS